ncbi:MAG: site-specific integrase [Sedimentisphaerales bacterium]
MSDGYESCERALGAAKKKVEMLPVSANNRKAILDFSDSCFSEGLSTRRVLKYLYTLARIATWVPKEFPEITRQDIETLVTTIERSNYSEWTKHDYRVTLKKFFRWLRHCEDGYPPEVKWLRTTMRKHRTKLPEEILTQEEVRAMITAATNARDKAFIAALYESGCRVGELLNLQIRQIQPHQHGFQIIVTGKKGPRRLLLIASAPYLADWLNQHPKSQEPPAPLWVTDDYRSSRLTYSRLSDILRTVAKRASIKKAVNPHNFRHSRATHLAQHLTEAQMNEYMGWVQGSDMPSTYVHLSGRDVDNALLKLNKISVSDKDSTSENFSLRACPRCSQSNPPANKFCSRCGMILDEKTARDLMKSSMEHRQADTIMDKLLEDSEFRSFLEQKLEKLNTAVLQK